MDPEAKQKFIRDCMAKLAVLEEEQADHEDALAEAKTGKERREHEKALEGLDTQIRGLYAAVESVMRAKAPAEEGEDEEDKVAEEWDYAETALFAREDYTHLLQEILDENEELRKRWNMPRSKRAAARMAPSREAAAAPKAQPTPAPAPKTPAPAPKTPAPAPKTPAPAPKAAPASAPAGKTPAPAAPEVPTVSTPSDKPAAPAPFRVPPVPRPGAKTPASAPAKVAWKPVSAAKTPVPAPAAETPVPSSAPKEPEQTAEPPEPDPEPDDSAPTLEAPTPKALAGESQPILDPTASQTLSESRVTAAIGGSAKLKIRTMILIGVAAVAFVAWIVWLAS
jgi:hypothetical protein